MLDHLINFNPEVLPIAEAPPPVAKVTPVNAANGKINTADWLKEMGVPDADAKVSELEKQHAREAFQALTAVSPVPKQHELIERLETPAAVRHLTGMLTAYDWEFIHQAKELRGYAVAKILEECENPNSNIRLKALGLLGKVTEVGLFTEKIEVKKMDLTEHEIDAKLKEKLAKFMNVQDADIVDIEPEGQTAPANPANPANSTNTDENDIDAGNPAPYPSTNTDENDIDPDNPDA